MDLSLALEECEVAIRKFFSNDLIGAMNIMKPWWVFVISPNMIHTIILYSRSQVKLSMSIFVPS